MAGRTTGTRRREIALLCLGALLAGAGVARAQPDGGGSLTLALMRGGSLTRVRLVAQRLVAENAFGETTAERSLAAVDKGRLLAAARLCTDDPRPRRACSRDETFLSVTLDGHTNSAAICGPGSNHPSGNNQWQALLDLVRGLLR